MKALIVSLLIAVHALTAVAQGVIVFQNAGTSLVMLASPGGAVAAPLGTHVALYYLPAWFTTPPGMDQLEYMPDSTGVVRPVPGRFALGVKTTNADVPPGGHIWVQVRGWTGNYSSWDTAWAAAVGGASDAVLGFSQIFQMPTGDALDFSSPPVPLTSIPEFTGFTLASIPEPGTTTLLALAAAAFSVRRWRAWAAYP